MSSHATVSLEGGPPFCHDWHWTWTNKMMTFQVNRARSSTYLRLAAPVLEGKDVSSCSVICWSRVYTFKVLTFGLRVDSLTDSDSDPWFPSIFYIVTVSWIWCHDRSLIHLMFPGFCQPPIHGPLWIKWRRPSYPQREHIKQLPHSTCYHTQLVTSLQTDLQLAALTVRSDKMSFADRITVRSDSVFSRWEDSISSFSTLSFKSDSSHQIQFFCLHALQLHSGGTAAGEVLEDRLAAGSRWPADFVSAVPLLQVDTWWHMSGQLRSFIGQLPWIPHCKHFKVEAGSCSVRAGVAWNNFC